jgi:predicted dehydrogenase
LATALKAGTFMLDPIRVLLVGAGHMGTSHGRAYAALDGFELCGVVSRGESGAVLAAELAAHSLAAAATAVADAEPTVPHFRSFADALVATRPDAVCIASFPETHVQYASEALTAGCHVFVEKPLAESTDDAMRLVALAESQERALVVGYILRHHPSWQMFIDQARTLGKPLVMRMNLNQQSSGPEWVTHQSIMASMSPIVDCGVHYVDVMTQMTGARATRVSAIGARLTDDLPDGMYNYGQMQIHFEDGSVGWYEAGWGPMISETAYFVKDVIGPKGAISIEGNSSSDGGGSADVNAHTATNNIRVHHAELDETGSLARADDVIETADEPDHDELCLREQEWFLASIRGETDVGQHLVDVVESLRIVLAADESVRLGQTVNL